MRFSVTAQTAVFVNGKIKTVSAGELETTDKDFIQALEKAKGVNKLTPKAKPKTNPEQE